VGMPQPRRDLDLTPKALRAQIGRELWHEDF
jgi:hypothetical protein